MSNYDIHEMMDRAHFAEIREQRLRIEVDRLEAENARLAIDISEITKAAEVWLRRRNEIASQRDRLEVECDRLRKAVHDLQLFVQDSRGLKIIADALSPTEGAGAALPDASDQPRNAQ